MNIRTWLEEKAEKNASRPALVFQDLTATYREFNEQIDRVANCLADLEIRKGEKVVLLLPNCPEYLYLWFALGKLGAVAACINLSFRGEGLRFLIDSSDARYAVVHRELAPAYAPLRPGLKKVERTLWFPEPPPGETGPGDLSYRDLVTGARTGPLPPREIKAGAPWTFLHTSGTTGRPKWCILSHGYYLEQGQTYADSYGFSAHDRIFNPLPLYHANPQVYLVIGSLAVNATMISEERFSASAFWEQAIRYRATVAILHMAPLEFLKKQPFRPEERKHNLRFIFPADREFAERFGIRLVGGGYGLTEAALIFFQKFHFPLTGKFVGQDPIRRFCGKPSANVEAAILDEEDRVLVPGITGEIALRPRRPNAIFSGYYQREDKTVESWSNLWFHTGDLGFFDEDGDLNFVRRASESINVKGEWVDVMGLEDLLRSHPRVLDAAVVGVAHPAEGKRIKACIQTRPGEVLRPEDLLDFCAGKIAHFMIPHYVEFMEELPRLGGTEKVAKAEMEAAGITEKTWDREKSGYEITRDEGPLRLRTAGA